MEYLSKDVTCAIEWRVDAWDCCVAERRTDGQDAADAVDGLRSQCQHVRVEQESDRRLGQSTVDGKLW